MSRAQNTRISTRASKTLFTVMSSLILSACEMSSRIGNLTALDVFKVTSAPTINLANKTSAVFSGKCAVGMTSFNITEPLPEKMVSCGANRDWTVEFDFSSEPDGLIKIKTDYSDPVTGSNLEFEVLKDTQRPEVKLNSDILGETNLSSIPIDVDFSEVVTGFTKSDVSVVNGIVTSVSGSGAFYKIYVQPQGSGLVTVEIADNIAKDLAGNQSTTMSGPVTFTYDGIRPSVVLSTFESNPTNNSSVSVTVTFSEDVDGLVPADFVATGALVLSVNGSGSIYQMTLTPLIPGLVQLQLPLDKAFDIAGNGNAASNVLQFTYDNHNPIPTLSSSVTSPSNVTVLPVAVNFDRAVNGINASDFVVTNGTISDLAGSGSSYTFNLTPTSEGTVEVSLPAAVTQSAVGNANAASNNLSIAIDRTPGVLSISNPSPTSGHAAINFVWTLTYSDYDVITLTNADIDLVATGNVVCTDKTVASPTAATRTVIVSGCSGEGTIAFEVAAGTAKDEAGNLFAGNTASTAIVTNTLPTIAIGDPSPTSGDLATTFTWSVTYGGATTVTLSAADIVLSGAAEGCGKTVTEIDSTTRQVQVSGCTDVGSLAISIAAGTAVGIGGTAAASTVSVPVILTNQVLVSLNDLLGVVDKNASGTSSQSFLLSLNKAFSKDVEIIYDLIPSRSTATNPLHHNIQKGSVLIPAGHTTASIDYQYNDGATMGSKFIQIALVGTSQKVVGISQPLSRRLIRDIAAKDAEYISISAGESHTCVVKSGGELYCWGANDSGQLGNDSTAASRVPVLIGSGYASVVSGSTHTCALKSGGELYCWGANGSGQLGNSSTANSIVPVLIDSGYISVTAGRDHTCALKSDGELWCWGGNGSGQLGNNSTAASSVPVLIGSGYASVAAGSTHTCAVKSSGELYCWGNNGSGQLGNNSSTNSLIPILIDNGYANVSAGENHTCGVKSGGELYCWGANGSGQLGTDSTAVSSVPVLIGSGYASVSAGVYYTCGVKSGGELYCWGYNGSGQLGNKSTTNSSIPVSIGSGYSSVSAGVEHTCAVKINGDLYCWGKNSSGQLGNNSTVANISVPILVGGGYTSVSAGGEHTCALKTSGLYCWGENGYGQLGNNSWTKSSIPILIGSGYANVKAGTTHTCAVKFGGDLFCWGNNANGRLGVTPAGKPKSSVPVSIGAGYESVSVGGNHTCAVKSGTGVYCWGANGVGQLGNNSTTSSFTPLLIHSGFVSVSVGRMHTCATKFGGELYCWGFNGSGQLGNNSEGNSLVPVWIGNGYTDVSAGGNHTCAVNSGELRCWGAGEQLGDGSISPKVPSIVIP